MIPTLDTLLASRYLSDLDYHFAITAARIAGEDDSLAMLAAAVASRYTNMGHICVRIGELAGKPIDTVEGDPVEGLTWPDLDAWRKAIAISALVAAARCDVTGNSQLAPISTATGTCSLCSQAAAFSSNSRDKACEVQARGMASKC